MAGRYPETARFPVFTMKKMTPDVIDDLQDLYRGIITDGRIELLKRFIVRKVQMLNGIVRGDN